MSNPYPHLKTLFSDFVRERGVAKPFEDDSGYPFRLEIVSTNTEGSGVLGPILYGSTPKSIIGAKSLKELQDYIEAEGLKRSSYIISLKITDREGKVLQ